MNRLRPLIVRRVGSLAASRAPTSELLEDLKMFALVWLGGLVFFGTLIA